MDCIGVSSGGAVGPGESLHVFECAGVGWRSGGKVDIFGVVKLRAFRPVVPERMEV